MNNNMIFLKKMKKLMKKMFNIDNNNMKYKK